MEYCESLEISKNGVITLNADEAFSYELGWTVNLQIAKVLAVRLSLGSKHNVVQSLDRTDDKAICR